MKKRLTTLIVSLLGMLCLNGIAAPSVTADPVTDLSLSSTNRCGFSRVVAQIKNVNTTSYIVRVDLKTSTNVLQQRVATAVSGSTIEVEFRGVTGSYTAKLYYKSGSDFLEVPGATVTGQHTCQIETSAVCSGKRVEITFKNTGTARVSMYVRRLLPAPQQGSYDEVLPGEIKTRLVAVTLGQPYAITTNPVNGVLSENVAYFAGICTQSAPA